MLNLLKMLRKTVFIYSMSLFMTQKAMIIPFIPLPLVLQKTLLVGTYGYGLFSLGQHYKWFPKNMLLTNRAIDKTKKDIEKDDAETKAALIELFNTCQKEVFFMQIKMCKEHNDLIFAKKAEENSLNLRLLALSWSDAIQRPLGAFRL